LCNAQLRSRWEEELHNSGSQGWGLSSEVVKCIVMGLSTKVVKCIVFGLSTKVVKCIVLEGWMGLGC